jgi:hypothetical protein
MYKVKLSMVGEEEKKKSGRHPLMNRQNPSSFPSAEELWTAEWQKVCERMGILFARSETRKRAQIYLQCLLSPIERKNGWQVAEEASESTPYAMQYLLDRAVWDVEQLRDVLREYVIPPPKRSPTSNANEDWLALPRPISFSFRLTWSFFRRAHQAIARRSHYKRRLAALT